MLQTRPCEYKLSGFQIPDKFKNKQCWDFNEESNNKTANKLHAFASTKGGGVIKWDPKQSCKLALKCMTISLCMFHMVLSLQQNCTEGVGHQISAWGVGLLFANED